MAEKLADEALARTLQQMGAVSLDQIEAARLEQARQAKHGSSLSLGEVLIQQGVITAATIENVASRVQASATGGVKQLGPYKLIRKLGEGGMGAVYLAEDTQANRPCAIKILPRKFSDDQRLLARFHREAVATGKLNHANIVCAYTVGEENGVHYYAMEYCDGIPLDDLLKRAKFIPWALATRVVMQVASGLKHAHEHGILHRDIKPANIFICRQPGAAGVSSRKRVQENASPLELLSQDFVAKILDLGLSKDLGSDASAFYTQTGMAMGTPDYISPEQAQGEKQIDGRTDIYSLGATYYHLVTGERPFTGSTAAIIMMKHIQQELPDPQGVNAEIPDGVALVIQGMMAKAPADRYQNCVDLLEDLERVIDGKEPLSDEEDVEEPEDEAEPGAEDVDVAPVHGGAASGRLGKPAAQTRRSTRRQVPVTAAGGGPEEGWDKPGGPSSARSRKTLYLAAGGVGLVVMLLVGFLFSGPSGDEGAARHTALEKRKSDEAERQRKENEARQEQEAAGLKEAQRKRTEEQQKAEEARLKEVRAKQEAEAQKQEAEKFRLAEEMRRLADAEAKKKAEAEAKKKAEAAAASQQPATPVGTQTTDPATAIGDRAAPGFSAELVPGVKMEFVLVKPGDFLMGGPGKRQTDAEGNEDPVHKVTLSKPYGIGKYPVTVAQFSAFVNVMKYVTECEKGGNKGYSVKDGKWGMQTGINWRTPGFAQTPDHPVVMVSWNDAQAFAAWTGKQVGRDVRLPTEAQWEYAARGPLNGEYPFGDKWDGSKVNHRDAALVKSGFQGGNCSEENDGYAFTSPVAKLGNASWCGAFDMAGNVWQWVQDWEADYTAGAQVDPVGPANGRRRVLRGGSWDQVPACCHTAHRARNYPNMFSPDFGFRVVVLGLP